MDQTSIRSLPGIQQCRSLPLHISNVVTVGLSVHRLTLFLVMWGGGDASPKNIIGMMWSQVRL